MCGLLVCCRFLELVRKILDGNLIRTVEQLGETLYTDLCLNFRDVAVVGGGRPSQPLLCEVALKMVCAAAHKVYLRKAIAAAKVEAPAPVAHGAALGTFRDFGSAEDVQCVSGCVLKIFCCGCRVCLRAGCSWQWQTCWGQQRRKLPQWTLVIGCRLLAWTGYFLWIHGLTLSW